MNESLKNLDYKTVITHQKSLTAKTNRKKDDIIEHDNKIVSFKIGNEFYGINIMAVKEIKKLEASKFTFVPNTLDFVVGVHNLRGNIIPIIDIAKMFHLKYNNEQNPIKSVIVIKVEELLIGLVVEEIQHVIAIRKSDIQPPSPLLGTINERYIEGVVEIDQRLYVIFDTESIFSAKTKSKKEVLPQNSDISEEIFLHYCTQIEEFSNVHINDVNRASFRELINQFPEISGTELKSLNKDTTDQILSDFYSQFTSALWDIPYINYFKTAVINELDQICSDKVRILTIGCGNGQEAYSVFFLLNEYYKEAELQMVAADINLSSISKASGLEIDKNHIPAWINLEKYFTKVSDNLYKIKREISNKIYFEFHNVKNLKQYKKEFDLVVARDLSLNLSDEDFNNFIKDVAGKITSGGLLILGDKENINTEKYFTRIVNKNLSIYKRN